VTSPTALRSRACSNVLICACCSPRPVVGHFLLPPRTFSPTNPKLNPKLNPLLPPLIRPTLGPSACKTQSTGNNSKNCGLYILSTIEGSGPQEGGVSAGQGGAGAEGGGKAKRLQLDAGCVRLYVHVFNDGSHIERVNTFGASTSSHDPGDGGE